MSRKGCKNLIPSARAVAKANGDGRYFGSVCARHPEYKGERLTASGHCYGCAKESVAKAQAPGGSQHERARANTKQYYKDNAKRIIAQQKAKRTPEQLAQDLLRLTEWGRNNIEKAKQRTVKWAKANVDKINAKNSKRRATKIQATPAWTNDFFIKEAYHLAKLREKTLGGRWHVDHIVPLKSKLVCGLHTEINLQVIPANSNLIKSNSFWPQMPT